MALETPVSLKRLEIVSPLPHQSPPTNQAPPLTVDQFQKIMTDNPAIAECLRIEAKVSPGGLVVPIDS